MPNPQYLAGRRFEYRVAKDLTKRGYECKRSPGSKGPYDIFAIADKNCLLVQVKAGAKAVEHSAWNTLVDVATGSAAVPVVADRDGRKIRYRLITGYHTFRSRDWPAEEYQP